MLWYTYFLQEPLEYLAELLVCLLKLETLLTGGLIKEHFILYKNAIRSIYHSPAEHDITLERLHCLYKCLTEIYNSLLSDTILQQTLEKCSEESILRTLKKSTISNEITLFVQQVLTELEKEDSNINYSKNLLHINVLVAFYYSLFGNIDKKISKKLLEVNKKV